ncbi:MAG: hypothetical protein AB8C46_17770 [Burkholderiaceae bacterium]
MNITPLARGQRDDARTELMWRGAMGSLMTFDRPVSASTLKENPDLLRQARRLGIRSAERSKLEAMCAHAGLRHAGLPDAALRRALEAVIA